MPANNALSYHRVATPAETYNPTSLASRRGNTAAVTMFTYKLASYKLVVACSTGILTNRQLRAVSGENSAKNHVVCLLLLLLQGPVLCLGLP